MDPLAKKYPGWSPYNYVEDDPTGFVDPNGAQQKPSWWDIISPPSNNLTLPPLTLANQNGSDPASISANGLAASPKSSMGSSLLSFAQRTASMASTTYFWVGVGTGVLAAGTAAVGQIEFSLPLGEVSGSSFAASAYASMTNATATFTEGLIGMKSQASVFGELTGQAVRFGFTHFMEVSPGATAVATKVLEHQSEEVSNEFVKSLIKQEAH